MTELENDDIMFDAPLVRMPKSSYPVYLIDVKSYDRMELAVKIVDAIVGHGAVLSVTKKEWRMLDDYRILYFEKATDE